VAIPQMDEPAIEAVYSQSEPNEPISLGAVNVEFVVGNQTCTARADVSMRLTPDNRLCFVVPPDEIRLEHVLKAFTADAYKLKLADRGVTVDAICVQGGAHTGLTFIPKESCVTVTPPSGDIVRAIFHLFNFPDFVGPEDYSLKTVDGSRQTFTPCGRVTLRAEGWNVTIAATGQTEHACKALRRNGGFIITHMGRIARDDGAQFSSQELAKFLHCVHVYLSFALGRWAGVALPLGFDENAARLFEQWGMPRVSAGWWNASDSWFDSTCGETLSHVFPGFVGLWRGETWGEALWRALYWYLGANTRGTGVGVDTALILAQAALEQLAWTYSVRDRKMVSESAFGRRGLSGADKMRLLLSSLDIPAGLPDGLRALHAKRGKKWEDGPEAITGIRNALVHPREKDELAEGSYYEAWQLSMWFLDLALLRLCRYEGQYANRLTTPRWAGRVEPVPWAQARNGGRANG
jgi:hypothetical protein